MSFSDTRQQLHWAAQAAAGVGRSLLPPKPDDSHQSFEWSDQYQAIVQGPVDGRYRSGIRMHDMTLLLIDDQTASKQEFPLHAHTLDDGFHFYEERFGKTISRPGEGIPTHKVANGAVFTPQHDDLDSIAEQYSNANAVLQRYRANHPGASEVRVWPHHFDIATLIPLGGDQTIGAGSVAGDAQCPEPYWYVTPFPYPEDRSKYRPLSRGFWNTDGWFGAVLLGNDGAAEFLEEATSALLER
ncbi:MAG TPA: hypothetical protein VHU41_15435 [Thermoanaerobaculia bacterium]|nr:hypothetical protein [Thermoanaerobaculia bacterium]